MVDLAKYQGKSRKAGNKTYIHFTKGSTGYDLVKALRSQNINVNMLVSDLLKDVTKK